MEINDSTTYFCSCIVGGLGESLLFVSIIRICFKESRVFVSNSNLFFKRTLAISFFLFKSLCLRQLTTVIIKPMIGSKSVIVPMNGSKSAIVPMVVRRTFVLIFLCGIENVIVCVLVFANTICFSVEILLSLKVLNIWIWLNHVVYIMLNCFQLLEQEIQGGSKMMKINLGKECTFCFR